MLPLRNSKGEFQIRFRSDDAGQVIKDNPCPIGCGFCCKYWRQVKELAHLARRDVDRCPYLRKTGCRLKRSKMPVTCRAFTCELAILALEGLVSREEIRNTLAAGEQERAFAFLSKEPPTRDLHAEDLSAFGRRVLCK
jgi:hypothetical protein